MTEAPQHCREAAFELFIEQLPTLEETGSLLRAAVAVSMHELEFVDVAAVEKTLDELAGDIGSRVRSGSQRALVAQLHEVLFEEWGFTGNADDYYNTENSYVPRVLETRRGIPVTLSLIYKCVAQRLGLTARGINAPAHFLSGVEIDGSWMTVDPFQGGRVMTRDEVFNRLEQLTGAPIARSDALLATATHREWLARIIRNLEQVFSHEDRQTDVLAMRELLNLVHGTGLDEPI
jgi:regulator of sirC expression with transglutaminase-like and TPR domain